MPKNQVANFNHLGCKVKPRGKCTDDIKYRIRQIKIKIKENKKHPFCNIGENIWKKLPWIYAVSYTHLKKLTFT